VQRRLKMPAKVVGVEDVLKGLSFFDDDMYNRIKTVLGPLMRDVESTAKSYVPGNSEMLSGWSKPISSDIKYRPFPKYNAALVKGGIGYKEGKNVQFKNGFQVENYVYNVSAAGRIYETAGRRNPQGRAPIMSTTLKELGNVQGYEGKKSGKKRSTRDYSSNNPFAGYQFVSALEPVTLQPKTKGVRSGGVKTKGRLIYKAWAKDSHKVYEAIIKAVDNSVDDFNNKTLLYPKAA
jgi:hypothetical protein